MTEQDRILWLSRDDVRRAGGGDPQLAVPLIEGALVAHAAGESCQPLKPYLRIPNDPDARRIIAMPAYLGGEFQTWGMKWIASAPRNSLERGMERASALVILNDLETGRPVAMMEGALISATRTAAVALVASKRLIRPGARSLAVIGNGMIGELICRSLLRLHPELDTVRLYDHDADRSRAFGEGLAADHDVSWQSTADAESAVRGSDVVVTATTAAEGYMEGSWFAPGSLFLNVSLRDPNPSVVRETDKLVVDDWDQVNRSMTIVHRMTESGELDRSGLHAELHELISGTRPGRESDDERIVVCPMGLSIEDVVTAWGVYNRAREAGYGQSLPLFG
ncbi:MAG: 2,3-diaminopropionate biosynthesis protein SbnB [Acidobacteriota bacterium]